MTLARLETEFDGRKAQLDLMQDQAQSAERVLTDMRPQKRGWFGWGKG